MIQQHLLQSVEERFDSTAIFWHLHTGCIAMLLKPWPSLCLNKYRNIMVTPWQVQKQNI